MAIFSDAGALVGTWWNQVMAPKGPRTSTETTVAPAALTARTDLGEAQQALGQPLPFVIGTGRVDGVYFIGGVETVATVTTTSTTTNDIPENYVAVSGILGGQVFQFGPPPRTITTSTTEYENRTLAGYVLAYDWYERGYNLIRLEIDGAVVFDAENDIAETTNFRFYGGRHTTVDPILTQIIGANPGAYQNFVMVFLEGYPSDSPPSISAVISNATDSTPVGGIIEWTGAPPTTGPFPPGVGTNYPHGASYDPVDRVIYQIIDATDVAGLTHVYLATLDVDTRTELYRVPLEGSESFADTGDYQLTYPIAMPGTGFALVHLLGSVAGDVTAVYETSTGRLVASHADAVNTLWREVMQFGTAWVFFAMNGGGQAAIVDLAAETIDVSAVGTGMSVQLVTRGRTTTGSVSFFIVQSVGGGAYDIHEAVYDGTWTIGHVIAPAGIGTPVTAVVPVMWYDPLTGYLVFQDTLPGPVNRFKYVNPDTGAVVDTFDVASNDYFNVHNLVPPMRFTSEPGFMLAQEISAGNNIDLLDIQAKTFTRYISDLVASDYTRFCRIIVDQTQNLYATAEQAGGATSAADHWTVWRVVNVNPRLIDLEDIITDAMSLAGFGPPDLTFEGIAGRTSYGFVVASDTTVQAIGRSLSDIYDFSWCDTGAGFFFKKAGQDDLLSVDAAFDTPDIVERDQPVISQDEANIRTPSSVEMQYVSKEGQYKTRPVSFNMTTGVLNSITTPKFSTPILFNDAEAQRIVQEKFFEYQEKRRGHSLAVVPENITLLPGDIVSFPSGTRTYVTRVEEVGIDLRNMGVEISARDFQTDVESPITAVSNTGPVWQVVYFASQYVHLDMPLFDYDDDTAGASLVQYGTLMPSSQALWSGGTLFRSPVTTDFAPIFSQLPHPGVLGVCETLLGPPADPFALDDTSTLTIRRTTADATLLVDATEAEVLAGVNNALIGVEGRWEWVGYKTVVDNLDGTYTLSGFTLRGYRGSEVFCGLHAIGDVFVTLDGWTRKTEHPPTDLGVTKYYKAAGIGQPLDVVDPTQHVITGAAETPYAPTRVAAEGGSPDGIDITWDYRSRITTGFNPAEHGEATLAFQVDIYDADGTTYIRTLTTTTNSVHYASADVITDFGSDPPVECFFRVYMMSALPIFVAGQDRPVAGRGYEARGHFPTIMLLLSGDMQSGTDHLKLSGDAAPGNILVTEE
jgi:hypothetical protein